MDKPNLYEEDGNRKQYENLLNRNRWGKDPNIGIDGPNIRISAAMRDVIRTVAERHGEAIRTSISELAALARLHAQVLDGEHD